MREKVWFEPGIAPGVGLRAVALKRRRFLGIFTQVRILFRDVNGKCAKMWVPANECELART